MYFFCLSFANEHYCCQQHQRIVYNHYECFYSGNQVKKHKVRERQKFACFFLPNLYSRTHRVVSIIANVMMSEIFSSLSLFASEEFFSLVKNKSMYVLYNVQNWLDYLFLKILYSGYDEQIYTYVHSYFPQTPERVENKTFIFVFVFILGVCGPSSSQMFISFSFYFVLWTMSLAYEKGKLHTQVVQPEEKKREKKPPSCFTFL